MPRRRDPTPVTDHVEHPAFTSSLLCEAGAMTITRMWRGWTSQAAAGDYERFLAAGALPVDAEPRRLPGRGRLVHSPPIAMIVCALSHRTLLGEETGRPSAACQRTAWHARRRSVSVHSREAPARRPKVRSRCRSEADRSIVVELPAAYPRDLPGVAVRICEHAGVAERLLDRFARDRRAGLDRVSDDGVDGRGVLHGICERRMAVKARALGPCSLAAP